MNLTPLNDLTYLTTNLANSSTPAWDIDAGYLVGVQRTLNNKKYETLGVVNPLVDYIYDNRDPLNPHYTTVANTGLEVVDNTAVPCIAHTTMVYVFDNDTYYRYKSPTGNVDFTSESIITPSNFDIVGVGEVLSGYRHDIYNPETTPLKWDDLGYTNKYKCLDQSLSSQTVGNVAIDGGDMTMSFIQNKVDEIYLINIFCSEVTVVVNTTDLVPIELYNETTSMISKNGGTFYNYFFNDFIYKNKANQKIPIAFEVKIDITIKNLGGVAKVGLIGIGRTNYSGATLYGAGIGMIDFGEKQTNQSTGENFYQQGNYKATNNLTVDIHSGLTDVIYDLLVKYRGIPVAFRSDGYDSLIIFGIYNKFNILISTPTISKMSIDLESLV